MTTPSAFSGTGLSMEIRNPVVLGGESLGEYTNNVNSYSHTISVIGGFTSGEFALSSDPVSAESWLQTGLGRHVITYSPSGQIMWEGFVNQLNITLGGVEYSRGPLVNMGNRVMGIYTPILAYNEGEAVLGATTVTPVVDNYGSIAKFGIWEKTVNLGTVEYANALYMRDLFLEENSSPEGFPTLNLGGSNSEVSVRIQCRGYYDWLGYIYNYGDDAYDALSITTSAKIKAVLAADPNDIFSTTYSSIGWNGVLVYDKETENRTARTIIEEAVSCGGGDYDRWMFGFYANRMAKYNAIPTTVEYLYHKVSRTQSIETIDGKILRPWEVEAGKWVAIPDVMTSSMIKVTAPRDDPRVFFGEEVVYSAPDEVKISGSKVRRLAQYMERLGLGGA